MAKQTIIKTSRELTQVEKYLMTMNPGIVSIKDVPDGTSIDVDAYLIFEDEKDDGEVSTICSIINKEKEVYSAQSKTFRDSLESMADIMGEVPFSIIKISGTTKAGRPYVNCTLDVGKLS